MNGLYIYLSIHLLCAFYANWQVKKTLKFLSGNKSSDTTKLNTSINNVSSIVPNIMFWLHAAITIFAPFFVLLFFIIKLVAKLKR